MGIAEIRGEIMGGGRVRWGGGTGSSAPDPLAGLRGTLLLKGREERGAQGRGGDKTGRG